jgi:hypothetical protein
MGKSNEIFTKVLRKLFQERAVERENSSMMYLIHYKNCYKYSSVPPPSTTIKIKDQKLFKG